MSHPIDTEINRGVEEGVFPGASLLVSKVDKILWDKVYGYAQIKPEKRNLSKSTLFDISSLTKPVCTATTFMLAIQEGKCSLDDPLEKYFPSASKRKITIRHLLNHTSGFPAWKPYFRWLIENKPDWILNEKGKEWLISQIIIEPLENTVGEKTAYSDLGYILLGCVLEKIYRKNLDQLFEEKIAKTLKLKETFFNALNTPKRKDPNLTHFAATETYEWRHENLCGIVMDAHAYIMGGVAGHAGLFSTTKDLRKWLDELKKARKGLSAVISRETFDLFSQIPAGRDLSQPYFTLGFDTPSAPSSSGQYFSSKSIGHLGYTGSSFWWNLEKDFYIILLTNRVHPTRKNQKIKEFRPKIHDVIIESLGLR